VNSEYRLFIVPYLPVIRRRNRKRSATNTNNSNTIIQKIRNTKSRHKRCVPEENKIKEVSPEENKLNLTTKVKCPKSTKLLHLTVSVSLKRIGETAKPMVRKSRVVLTRPQRACRLRFLQEGV
jgi:hypothetical protein